MFNPRKQSVPARLALAHTLLALALIGQACEDRGQPLGQSGPEQGQAGMGSEQSAGAGTEALAGEGGAAPQAGSPVVVRGPDDEGKELKPQETVGRESIGDTPVPCDLDSVLATSCRGCHGRTPGMLSPMALMTYEDLMAPSISDPETPVYVLVDRRVHDEAEPMPPLGGGRRLTDMELGHVEGWIADSMPKGAQDCGDTKKVEGPPQITYPEPSEIEDEIDQCYQFYAHQNSISGDTEPFQARNGEVYSAF